MNEIDKIISNLEKEIVATKQGIDQTESLARLKRIASTYNGEDQVVPFTDLVAKIKLNKDEFKIMSGWEGLDDLLKGFSLQQLVVVSALTKSGKTSFLMDLTSRIQEFHPLWFPFEESAEELIRKYLERGETPPEAFTPENIKGSAIDWIESKIVEAIAKYDTKVVFIDQLDFIVPMGGDNHHLAIARTMRDLKSLAKKWNVVIFIIAHLQKAKMDSQPSLEDLRGSSSIAQEADTVILLWRETKRESGMLVITNNVNVSVQANRRFGRTGNIQMVYNEGKFTEIDWSSGVSDVPNYPKQGTIDDF